MTHQELISWIILVSTIAGAKATVIVSVSETATLTFTNLPSTTTISSPKGVILVQKSSNTCTLKTTDKRFTLLTTSNCGSVVNLQLRSVAVTDAGDYKCSSSSKCVDKLVVLGTPSKPVITASTNDLRLNKDIVLTCKSHSTTKPSDHQLTMVYHWTKNGIDLDKTYSSMTITNVQKSQFNEKYACRASERSDKKSLSSNTYVLKPKYMGKCTATLNSLTSTSVSVATGGTITFKCTVDAYPTPSYIYVQNNGRTIQRFTNRETISITKKLNCSENISLRCYTRNLAGSTYSLQIRVSERCPPQLDASVAKPVVLRSSYIPAINKYFDLKMVGNPLPDYSIMKKSSGNLYPAIYVDLIPRSGYIRLNFPNFIQSVLGDYQLTANNSEGVFTENVSIKGLLPPAPSNVIVWSETPNSVHISWETTFEREYLDSAYYYVHRKIGSSPWSRIVSLKDSGFIMTYVISSLLPDTTYLFMVQGKRKSTYGFYSEIVTVRTIETGGTPQEKPPTMPSRSQQDNESTHPPTAHNKESRITAAGVGIGLVTGVVTIVIFAGIAVIVYRKRINGRKKPAQQTNLGEAVSEPVHSEGDNTYDRTVPDPASANHIYSNLPAVRNSTHVNTSYDNTEFKN